MKRFLIFVLTFILLISTLSFSVYSEVNDSVVTILFTHDLHSHIEPFLLDGNSVGGFARIQTIINETKSQNSNSIVVDAGDFSMGTLYQSVYEKSAAEYSMLAELGFDATTFGNHEFDYGFDAVRNMIKAAQVNASSLPPILCSNIDAQASGLSDAELSNLNILKYKIIKKGDYSIAVFGLLGRDAVSLSSSSNLTFKDYISSAKDTVSEIENLYSPDLIICLSHSGTGDTVSDEDVELAKAVPEINVIISGHTHTYLGEPIKVGNTIIGSCGEYGEFVGKIELDMSGDSPVLNSYKLIPVDDSIEANADTNSKIEKFKTQISDYLDEFGYESSDELLAFSPFDFPEQSSMGNSLAEQQLGNLISDSYVYALRQAEGESYVPVDVAVAPLGVIRASIDKGNVTVAQAFEISSLGIGNDGVAGYPLCSVYLYGRELWDLAEVDASVSGIMSYAQLYCSGLRYSVNTNRMFLNRVYDCWLVDENGNRVEIEDDKLYRVVSGMSSVLLLGTVKEKSFGLLELTPKDKNGNVITDFDEHIAKDTNGAEVKEWKALADYLSSFPKNENGISQIPDEYKSLQGRKNIESEFKLSQIFVNWSMISWAVLVIILALLSIIVIIVFAIIKKVKKNKKANISDAEEFE